MHEASILSLSNEITSSSSVNSIGFLHKNKESYHEILYMEFDIN